MRRTNGRTDEWTNGVLPGLLARQAGARLLVGSDPDPERRRLALSLGFDHAVDPGAEELKVLKVLIET